MGAPGRAPALRRGTSCGLDTYRARIQTIDDATAREIVVITFLQHKGLSAIEEARAYHAMLSIPGSTQAALAERLGISQGQISNRLRLLKLPDEFQRALITGEILPSVARDLVVRRTSPRLRRRYLPGMKRPKRAIRRQTSQTRFVTSWTARRPARRAKDRQAGSRQSSKRRTAKSASFRTPRTLPSKPCRALKDWNDSTLLTVARAMARELTERGLIKEFDMPAKDGHEERTKPAARHSRPAAAASGRRAD